MSTLKTILRCDVIRRQIPRRFMCTDSPDNGNKPEPKKEDIEIDKPINVADEKKKRMVSLLSSLKQSNVMNKPIEADKSFETEKLRIPQMSEVNRKYLFESYKVKEVISGVASHLGGDVDKTRDELHQRVSVHNVSKSNLKNLLGNMIVEHESPFEKQEPDMQMPSTFQDYKYEVEGRVRTSRNDRREFDSYQVSKGNNVGGQPLNIFNLEDCKPEKSKSFLTTYEKCVNHEMKSLTISAPKNAFEEMIKWTEEGRLWKFPVDNEVGMEEEKKYTFADHIFLERHLDPWCPKTGPIRLFMSLVCHGMSMNPYLTVNRKVAHIQWYQNYFMQKVPQDIQNARFHREDIKVSTSAEPLNFVKMEDYAITPVPLQVQRYEPGPRRKYKQVLSNSVKARKLRKKYSRHV